MLPLLADQLHHTHLLEPGLLLNLLRLIHWALRHIENSTQVKIRWVGIQQKNIWCITLIALNFYRFLMKHLDSRNQANGYNCDNSKSNMFDVQEIFLLCFTPISFVVNVCVPKSRCHMTCSSACGHYIRIKVQPITIPEDLTEACSPLKEHYNLKAISWNLSASNH